MLGKFDETFGEETARAWFAQLWNPSLVFWGLGALTYVLRYGVAGARRTFLEQPPPLQAALLLAVPLLLMVSNRVARRFDHILLRWLEGYWPQVPPFVWAARLLLWWHRRRRRALEEEWQPLQDAFQQGELAADRRLRLSRLEALLHGYPDDPRDMNLPTRLGLRLRAAETRARVRYGLDAVVCWPALWLVLPDVPRQELAAARVQLNEAVRFVFWAALSAVWSVWAWWAAPLALGLAWVGYRMTLAAAEPFATLVEATFALHRFRLYEALGLAPPRPDEDERRLGRAITRHLWAGEPLPGQKAGPDVAERPDPP